ncbi:MAG: glycosyltransferase [Burkholderiaceae bacterium]
MPYLAAAFDKITIMLAVERAGCRPTPANVTVDLRYADRRWKGARQWALGVAALRALRRPSTWHELGKALMTLREGPKQWLLRLSEWFRGTYRSELFADALARLPDAPTVCYHYWFTPEVLGTYLGLARRGLAGRVPIIVRAHGGDLYDEIQPSNHFAYRDRMIRYVTRVCTVSAFGRDYLAARFPQQADRIVVRRLGVSDPGFRNPQPTSGLSVISISNVIDTKRVDRIVDALAELARRRPEVPVKWFHVGDGPLMASIRERCKDMPANVSITFTGRLRNAEVFALFRSEPFDCLVNASTSEGIPVSIMEAFSTGLPVIAPGVGGIPEILDDGCGHLLPATPRLDEFVAALSTYLDKRASAPDRARAREAWARRYSAEVNYSQFVEELQESTRIGR